MLAHHSNEADCPAAKVGGWVNHVHIVCGLARTMSVAQLVEVVKRETSKWAKDRSVDLREFYWQNGYGAFSVSQSLLAQVIEYIERQAEHHRQRSYRRVWAFCARRRVEIDERYVWD